MQPARSRRDLDIPFALLGLSLAYLALTALTSHDPLNGLQIPRGAFVAFAIAYGIMRKQTAKMLKRLSALTNQTGLETVATSGLVPGTAVKPQLMGTLASDRLRVRSDKVASGGGPFTRIAASAMRNPESVARKFAADASADNLPILNSSFEGTVLKAEISDVRWQEHVASAILKLAKSLA